MRNRNAGRVFCLSKYKNINNSNKTVQFIKKKKNNTQKQNKKKQTKITKTDDNKTIGQAGTILLVIRLWIVHFWLY